MLSSGYLRSIEQRAFGSSDRWHGVRTPSTGFLTAPHRGNRCRQAGRAFARNIEAHSATIVSAQPCIERVLADDAPRGPTWQKQRFLEIIIGGLLELPGEAGRPPAGAAEACRDYSWSRTVSDRAGTVPLGKIPAGYKVVPSCYVRIPHSTIRLPRQ